MSEKHIVINDPNDGVWVMLRVGGVFNERTDHVIALHRDGKCAGGVVFTGFLHRSIILHMAGSEDNWATVDFLWMVFHYGFVQLGVYKLVGLVSANNARALSIDHRLGFQIEAKIAGACADGSDLLILTMTKDRCKWLKLRPSHYRSSLATEAEHGG
jgi:hypothetical protein